MHSACILVEGINSSLKSELIEYNGLRGLTTRSDVGNRTPYLIAHKANRTIELDPRHWARGTGLEIGAALSQVVTTSGESLYFLYGICRLDVLQCIPPACKM